MTDPDWQMKMLFEQMNKRMDAQDIKIENLISLITRYKDEVEKLWAVSNGRAEDLTIIRKDISMLTESVLSIKARMIDAAKNNDIKCLGEPDAVNG